MTSGDLLELVVAALLGPLAGDQPPVYATDAGARVLRPADWPTQAGQYPVWKVRVLSETKQSLGRSGPPQFTVTTTIRAQGEVSEPAAVDDSGASAAETALWSLQRQAEVAVINSYPLTSEIQQIASVQTQLRFNGDAATHLAGIAIDFALEFYQGPEDFASVAADELDEAHLGATSYPASPGFTANLQT